MISTEMTMVFTLGVITLFLLHILNTVKTDLHHERLKSKNATETALNAVRQLLHDDISSPLSRAYLLSFSAASNEAAVEQFRVEIRQTLNYLKDISHSDALPLGQNICLDELLSQKAQELRLYGINGETNFPDEKQELTPSVAHALLPVLDEITLNIVKYAQKDAPVAVSYSHDYSGVSINFENSVSANPTAESTRLGLNIAAQRLANVEGVLRTEQTQDRFKTTIFLPRLVCNQPIFPAAHDQSPHS